MPHNFPDHSVRTASSWWRSPPCMGIRWSGSGVPHARSLDRRLRLPWPGDLGRLWWHIGRYAGDGSPAQRMKGLLHRVPSRARGRRGAGGAKEPSRSALHWRAGPAAGLGAASAGGASLARSGALRRSGRGSAVRVGRAPRSQRGRPPHGAAGPTSRTVERGSCAPAGKHKARIPEAAGAGRKRPAQGPV